MEDLIESLTRGNPTEVKVVLASVVLALAVYQLVLIAIGYGKVRPPFLHGEPAAKAHRASGDTIATLLVVVSVLCVGYFGFEDGGLHAVSGGLLLLVLGLKVLVLRRWHSLGRYLPAFGLTVFVLLAVTWASSAGSFLS
jgi:hypothetical protein